MKEGLTDYGLLALEGTPTGGIEAMQESVAL